MPNVELITQPYNTHLINIQSIWGITNLPFKVDNKQFEMLKNTSTPTMFENIPKLKITINNIETIN